MKENFAAYRSVCWALVGFLLIMGCSPVKKAQKRFENGEYNVAINMYGKLVNKPKFSAKSNFMIGESYRLSNRIREAAPFYHAAIQSGIEEPKAELYYAMALKSKGEYEAAENRLEKYLDLAQEEELYEVASREIQNLNQLEELKEKGSYYEIDNVSSINTKAAEYSPFVKDGRFYFTSTRENPKIYKATGQGFSNVFVAKMENDQVKGDIVKSVGDFINTQNVNEGTITIAPNGRTMVFARGNTGKRRGTNDVNLYITHYRNKKWSDPRMMNINAPQAWDSNPAFDRSGTKLYFSSNREGGYGGTDLYVSHLSANGRWGNVSNLGQKINTNGNEMFPFVSHDGKLYFASNGHPGLGGLDLFVATKRRGKIKVESMGVPINSNADDFAFFLYAPNRGFLSSNRKGGAGDDDIYQFVNHDPNIKVVNYFLAGKTVTQKDEELVPLTDVRVRLMDTEENLISHATTDEEGQFEFRIDAEENYILIGEKPNYFTTRELYSTIGKSVDPSTLTKFETDIVFDTLLRLDKIVLEKAIVLENIYYDLDKADIRPDAALELDKLAATLHDNPEIKIELSSHTDSRADDDYNMDLSQRRAQSAVNYLISKGIEPNRLVARGYGETRLLNRCSNEVNCTEEEHQLNRRTEFKVIEFDQELNVQKTSEEKLEDKLFDEFAR